VDRSVGVYVGGVHRDDENARVPILYVGGRARGARSNASILQKSLAKAQARKVTAALRVAKTERASCR